MTGFITTGGNAAVNPFDLSQVPSSNVFEGQDPFSTSEALIQGLNRASINQTAADGGRDPFATPEGPQQGQPQDPAFSVPMISAQQANQKYAAPGLKFNNPLPDEVASEMYNAKIDENMRADVAARASSPVSRDVVSFAAGMLDPVNVAASFIPVLGEGNAARMAAAPVIDRIVTRGVQGAVQGAIGQVPLAGAQYALATQSQQDFTAADALKSVLMGAVFGGIAHPVVGAIGDALRPALPKPANDAFGDGDALTGAFQASPLSDQVAADPLLRQQAASAAIAAAVEDRPVDVAPLIELGARQRERALALRSMQYDATQPTALRLNALEDDMTAPRTPPELAENLAGQHEALQDIQASQDDLAKVQELPADPVTQARIDAIDEELTKPGPLSSVRQQALMQERGMLTQGAAPTTPDEIALNSARAEAQRRGNQIAIDRNNQRIAALQDQIRQSATVREALGEPAPEGAAASAQADATVKKAKPPGESQAPEDTEDFAKVIQGMRDRGQEFTTSKGSTYKVHEDGTTTRDKAYHPEHGAEDVGLKPRSEKTIYVDKNAAELSAAGLSEGRYRLALKDGKARLLSWNEKENKWGVFPSTKEGVPYSEVPEVGKHPVEAWGAKNDVPGYEAYGQQHAGNKIVEIKGGLTAEDEAMLSAADEEEAHADAMAKAHESFANCMAGL